MTVATPEPTFGAIGSRALSSTLHFIKYLVLASVTESSPNPVTPVPQDRSQ